MKVTQLYLTLCDPIDYTVRGILQVRILERVALSLLQWIFPTQESNGGLLRCRWSLYQLSYQGSPNTRAALMHSSLFLSFVCVWSPCTRDPGPCRWGETHTVPRPPHLRSHVPSARTSRLWSAGPRCVNKPGPWDLRGP